MVARGMTQGSVKMRGYVVQPGADQGLPDEAADPIAWMVNRLGTNDLGLPLQQAIFSNFNDDIVVEMDSGTLMGRYDPARGPAQRVGIGEGLSIQDGDLVASGVPGPEGPVGPQGPEGPAGASSSMFLYRFDSSTAASDPGAGRYRMNHATPASATQLYLDRLTADGLDPTTMFKLASFDDTLIIQERGNAARYQQWRITTPATDYTDWFLVPAVLVAQAGANFSNNNDVTFLLRTIGKQGPPGQWTQITQAAYNALSPPDPLVLYVIIG